MGDENCVVKAFCKKQTLLVLLLLQMEMAKFQCFTAIPLLFLGTWLILSKWCENGTNQLPALETIRSSVGFPIEKRYLSIALSHGFRYGNRLFDLASLYGLAETLRREPVYFVQDREFRELLEFTGKIVPGLLEELVVVNSTIPTNCRWFQFQRVCCKFEDPTEFKPLRDYHIHFTGLFYQSWKYFHHLRPKLLTFLPPLKRFPHLPEATSSTSVLCIHVRRTDFLDGNRQAPDKDFIRKAARLILDRESSNSTASFKTVIFGDDVPFEGDIFQETTVANTTLPPDHSRNVYVSTNTPEDDLLYASAHCNVTFISAAVSTFGWWMAYLSPQMKAYYVDIRYTNDFTFRMGEMVPEDYFLPSWIPLRMDITQNIVQSAI